MYLMVKTRPDLAFAVDKLSRFVPGFETSTGRL